MEEYDPVRLPERGRQLGRQDNNDVSSNRNVHMHNTRTRDHPHIVNRNTQAFGRSFIHKVR